MSPPPPHIFGIRHHGPGSARSLRRALEELQPDVILVEGPPDAAAVLPLLTDAQMEPPVALLIYVPDKPQQAVYYPFATFSPEWQAIAYGLRGGIPVRFMDLPQTHQMALDPRPLTDLIPTEEITPDPLIPADPDPTPTDPNPQPPTPNPHTDPLAWLAEAAGYSDSERWWEHMVEQRQDGADLFAAILEAMAALREASPPDPDPREALREAWMRQTIRAAQAEGFTRIAVVCGAWHGPALREGGDAKADAALLKGLPKVQVAATWVPWTYGRLSYSSGYGAGIESPGWYHHLWTTPEAVVVRWMARVAHLLRAEDLDASPAHIIEAVRLSETLAALRGRPLPGLPEIDEAIQAVFCFGSKGPMALIHEKLVVGETLGVVPDGTPQVPLQQDLAREQKRLRLPAEALEKEYDLDLRKEGDLGRSHLLHRLRLLGIAWGQVAKGGRREKGTFHEVWKLRWQPEFAVSLIEAGLWGTTILGAASAFARAEADKASELPTLTALVDRALLADLPDAVDHLMARVQAAAALASDVAHLMDALPPLVNIGRYGNVRRTDTALVGLVVEGLVARICIGLPGACASLNDEAAAEMFPRLLAVHDAIRLVDNPDYAAAWTRTLLQMADQQGLHGLLQGRCVRLLLDGGQWPTEEAARRMGLALSPANDPAGAAAWVEGFLRGSGLLLLHDAGLWAVLDAWVGALSSDLFPLILPLLRRTFATFAAPERRQMGERARHGPARTPATAEDSRTFDHAQAAAVLPLVAQLLGIPVNRAIPSTTNEVAHDHAA